MGKRVRRVGARLGAYGSTVEGRAVDRVAVIPCAAHSAFPAVLTDEARLGVELETPEEGVDDIDPLRRTSSRAKQSSAPPVFSKPGMTVFDVAAPSAHLPRRSAGPSHHWSCTRCSNRSAVPKSSPSTNARS